MSYQIQTIKYADSNSVGDWEGKEELAANKFNRVLDAIAERIGEYEDDKFDQAAKWAWDILGADEALLTLTDEQIEDVVERVI